MTFKKLLIILSITVTALVIVLLSTSYAWYQFDNAVTTFTDVQTFSENIDLAVVFTNSDNINTSVGIPLLESQIDTYASKTTFSMTPSSTVIGSKEVAYQISLIDLSVDSVLTETEDLKYSLIETIDEGTATTIASGNFKDLDSNTLVLKTMTAITTMDVTYSYEFRIWLQDNGCTLEQINNGECSDQNALMGKKITGKIKVSTALR